MEEVTTSTGVPHIDIAELVYKAEQRLPLVGQFVCMGVMLDGPCSQHCGQLLFRTPEALIDFVQHRARGIYSITLSERGVVLNSLQ